MASTEPSTSQDFSFPVLPAPTESASRKVPLTAFATVVDRSASSANASTSSPAPLQVAMAPPTAIAKAPRSKVPLEKGYSQVDWLRKTRSGESLNGLPTGTTARKDITLEEVKAHNKPDDAWMVLRGKVYNITPYLKFHPGGPDILVKASGRDATSLFQKYHAWVNADALLEKCLVGTLAVAVPPTIAEDEA